MFNKVKCLLEVKFEEDDFSLRLLTLVDVFEGPSKAVLYGAALNKPILVFMNELDDYLLQPISKKLCQKLKTAV